MGNALLETKGLHRFFGGLHAVNDVSIAVRQGTIKGVIGPNGAGKTTLFNLIAGTIQPHNGEVFFRDKKITALKPHAVACRGIAQNVPDHQTVQSHDRSRKCNGGKTLPDEMRLHSRNAESASHMA